MISQEKLAELERLYAAATGGTWKYTIAKSGRHQISNGMVQVGQVWHTTANPASATATAIAAIHNAFPELLATIQEHEDRSTRLYNALRQVIIAAGGIADPGVSDDFLIEYAPKEMAAIKAKL